MWAAMLSRVGLALRQTGKPHGYQYLTQVICVKMLVNYSRQVVIGTNLPYMLFLIDVKGAVVETVSSSPNCHS